MKKVIIVLGLIGFISTVASAKEFSVKTKIKTLYAYKTGAVIELDTPMSNDGCTYTKSGKYVSIRFKDGENKEMYATLLSAFQGETTVKIGTKGCDDMWKADGTMNEIYRVSLYKKFD